MRTQYVPMVILSAEIAGYREVENVGRRVRLQRQLRQARLITFKCLGSYKGQTESSVMVPLTFGRDGFKPVNLEDMVHLAQQFDQESILYQDNEGIAWLIYCATGEMIKLGKLTMVSEVEAKAQDAYTYVVESNSYWITK
jgi:hypothetical protein